MPVYFILSKSEFNNTQKKKITNLVTETHCTTTGAPSKYVTVIFQENCRLKANKIATILGNIRIGGNRTLKMINNLENKLVSVVSDELKVPSKKVGLQFLGVPSNWVWEGGQVLPPPGEESNPKEVSY